MKGNGSFIGAGLLLGVLSVVFFGCSQDGGLDGDLTGPARANKDEESQIASFQGLGSLASGQSSFAYGISGDGSVVVGFSYLSDGTQSAFRWTSTTGMEALGGETWWANAASYDGFYVVGRKSGSDGQLHGFRWNPVDGVVELSIFDHWTFRRMGR